MISTGLPLNIMSFANTNSKIAPSNAKGISFHTVELLTDKGMIIADIPSTSNILAILLPITLPIAKSGEPSNAAKRFTINSGADVPNETTVSPITSGEIFSFNAKDDAPLTIDSAPPIRIAKPRITSRMFKIIVIFNLSYSIA